MKAVAPALVFGPMYNDMEVGDGGTASRTLAGDAPRAADENGSEAADEGRAPSVLCARYEGDDGGCWGGSGIRLGYNFRQRPRDRSGLWGPDADERAATQPVPSSLSPESQILHHCALFMLSIQPFLTAYDPSDLPGASVDPLGFDRGYALLADKILPGLTNVASRPRYLSTLCAAIHISDERCGDADASPRARRDRRVAAAQRLERFWTLGCVLASREDAGLPSEGVRGIRYVEAAAQRLEATGARDTDGDFRLLSRQLTYGMMGIYGSVAEVLKFLDRETLALGPELGERVGSAFVNETGMPNGLQKAIVEEGAVNLTTLTKWATAAHLGAMPGPLEARALDEAFHANDVRHRMGALLLEHQALEGESELARIRRIARALAGVDRDPDLREALRAIVAFEDCYRASLLAFQRVLWFCQAELPFQYDLASAARDEVLAAAQRNLREASERLDVATEEGVTVRFREHLERLRDVRAFAASASRAGTPAGFVEHVMARHSDVQRAKYDHGRSKMAWLEVRSGAVTPTLAVAQHLNRAPDTVEGMPAHPYRTVAADRFCAMQALL